MGSFAINVEGLAELERALRALPAEVAGKNGGPLLSAVRKMAQVIRDEARVLAPEDTGRLKRAIFMRRAPGDGRGTEEVLIGARPGKNRNDPRGAYYYLFQELGAPNKGIVAQPFLRPAYDTKKVEVTEVFKREFKIAIETAAKKVSKGAHRGR